MPRDSESEARAAPFFFERAGPFRLEEIASLVGARIARDPDPSRRYVSVAPLGAADEESVGFLLSRVHAESLRESAAGACLLAEENASLAPDRMALLISDNPHRAYADLCGVFYPDARRPSPLYGEAGVSAAAHIHKTARLEDGITAEPGAVIGAEASIGRGAVICAHAVVGAGVVIGRESYLGPHVSVSHAIIGDRVFIHAGARIGQDGFAFAPHKKGLAKIPQTGRVIIQNDADIGANTAIDRGGLEDTVIGEGAKIDNLVQIGHNCRIGRYAILVAQVGLSGSVRIGDGAVLGGQVGVADHIEIGGGARVGAQSGVNRSLPAGGQYHGHLAKPYLQWRKEKIALDRLAQEFLKKRVKKGRGA